MNVVASHVAVGKRYLWLGFAMLLYGGILAMCIRWQLAYPGKHVPLLGSLLFANAGGRVSPASYTWLFTMHGTVMIFFALAPILIGGFGNVIVPLLIGARDTLFPRLNRAAFMLQLTGSVIMIASWWSPTGPGAAGWSAYPPLSTPNGTPGIGETLWVIAILCSGFATIIGAFNFVLTILRARCTGMTFFRLPLSVWGIFLASILNVTFVPILTVAMLLLLSDRVLHTTIFVVQPGAHGDPILYQHLFWLFGHPEVYILILPVWGFTSDFLSFFARKPAYGYRLTVYAFITVCVLSGAVYGHHMFTTSLTPLLGQAFMFLTLLISLPSMMIFWNWLRTLFGGAIVFTVPMLFSLGVLAVFAIGGLTGIYLADLPQDIYLHDSYFVVGHFHLIMAAALFLSTFAALYYWFPLLTNRTLDHKLGAAHFFLSFVPLVLLFSGMLLLGNAGMQRRLYDPSDYMTFRHLHVINMAISHLSFLLFFAQAIFLLNVALAFRRPRTTDQNPWRVGTLEWLWRERAALPLVVRGPHELSSREHPAKDWLGQNEEVQA